jgi:glycosyltransferase involved in cell wall biosynthesis
MKTTLSIGIPTYNRKNQLRNQLQKLVNQDLTNIEEIIIVDNNSDYDVSEVINDFSNTKLRLIQQPINIRMGTNMAFPFLLCKNEWLWLLSDDDEVTENAIENILSEIENAPPDTGLIKFSIERQNSSQRDEMVNSLEGYIDYYYNEEKIRRGDLVFISTNVYNLKNIYTYLGYAFEFSYTYVPQLIPIFKALNDKKISVKFSSKSIVKYIAPRDGGWSYGTVGKPVP